MSPDSPFVLSPSHTYRPLCCFVSQFRPLSDLKTTLLHEMIHAYLCLGGGKLDRDSHGEFDLLAWVRCNWFAWIRSHER